MMRIKIKSVVIVTILSLIILSTSVFSSTDASNPGDTLLLYGSIYDDHGDIGHPLTAEDFHLVTFDARVPLGETLSIQPGAQINFASGFKMISDGQLYADGTSTNPVSFSSYGDLPGIKLYHGGLRIRNRGYVKLGQGDLVIHRYVAPTAIGTGTGETKENAACYLNMDFWDSVQDVLSDDHVAVWFLDGEYSSGGLTLTNMGHNNHVLALLGYTDDGVILNSEVSTMLRIQGCKNMKIKDLNFRGDIAGYALALRSNGATSTQHIEIESCTWEDLENIYYGALGVALDCHYVYVRNCTFKRIGSGGHAHMMYNAYGPDHIYVIDNHFEDCAGSYVKFRDRADYGFVNNNVFVHTGTYTCEGPYFIEMTVHDDNHPPSGEFFGTNYDITNNDFLFPVEQHSSLPYVVIHFYQGIHNRSIDYKLVTPYEGEHYLESGDPLVQKNFLKTREWIEIDLDKITCFGNSCINHDFIATFESRPCANPDYDPPLIWWDDGEFWDDWVDISDAL